MTSPRIDTQTPTVEIIRSGREYASAFKNKVEVI